jgi:hypothetical protein
MRFIEHIYWKSFFAVYWLAYDLGEKDSPQKNASRFMIITTFVNMTSALYLFIYLSGTKPNGFKVYIVLSMVFSFVFNEFIVFSKKYGFKKKNDKYIYLSRNENKTHRNKVVFLISSPNWRKYAAKQ